MLCDYGCGQEASYQLKNGKWCCCKRPNSCPVIRKKNSDGILKSIKYQNRDYKNRYQNLPEDVKNRMAWSKGKTLISLDKVFIKNSIYSNDFIKTYINKHNLLPYKCNNCGCIEWNNKSINLELHHINGIRTDNRIENLCYLCPNCHSQTDNFRGRNINKGCKIVTDEQIIQSYKENKNIRRTLLSLGLAAKGGNYNRVKKLTSFNKV